MKTLLILRHAKSSWKHADLADRDRPLNKRGKRQAPEVGLQLKEWDLIPERILSSPTRRARDTAVVVAEESGFSGDIDFVADFYPGDPEDYFRVLRDLSDEIEVVMVVGHNPGLEDLVAMLTLRPEYLPTAALAQIELPIDRWFQLDEDTQGKLIRLWRPEQGDIA